ncbi:MAG TPA: thiamine pyrophosphate-dependent dehydrogenase E1 component subunit alpha [Polyangiaceae bacterium]|jgi:pyruvate dehydrogenase E1 component alpha subunit/2-oxoisovalerate dehydrogenase E1 component alpha subunit|nr:thiamine pyrophosphate-dependent dehydrogenase E1 component subunit alpha [Polyangiaceae bacterium]
MSRDGEVDASTPNPLFRLLNDDGKVDASRTPRATKDVALRAYRELKRLRVLDARMMLLQRQGRIGFYGTCTGQEAVPIASALAIESTDWVFQALRESSMMLVRGFPLAKYIAQIFGNAHDDLKGRMQPSHMSSKSVRQVSWSSCIGTQIPQAVGAAWAAKQRGDKTVVLGFMGDGATSEADFHAGLTFAGVFHVPCVLVCQNNHWAISVPASRQTASRSFAEKGLAYGVPSFRVDGNDFLAVYEVVSQAAERARRGEGPSFIECLTYRIGAHSSSDDPTRYRSQEEVDAWMKRDPVLRLKAYLTGLGALDDAAEEKLEKELNDEISAAITEAERHGPPDRETLFDDVYATLPWHLDEQRDELRASPTAPSHG